MSHDQYPNNVLKFERTSGVSSNVATEPKSSDLSQQLSLPFSSANVLIMVRDSDIGNPAMFIDFIENYGPRYLLDLRLAPRMDFIAGSRAASFKTFERLRIEYIDLMGRIGVDSISDLSKCKTLLSDSISSVTVGAVAMAGPVVCLYDDNKVFDLLRDILPSAIKTLVAGNVEPNISLYHSGLIAM